LPLTLDHILWATPALERGRARWMESSGTESRPGGSHPGKGTRNAIVPLRGGCYLEILAPDPAQELSGTVGEQLAALPGERLWGFCCRGGNLGALAREAGKIGLSARGPMPYSRLRPDGLLLRWSLLYVTGHPFGALMPFFIDWEGSPHPSEGDSTLSLTDLSARHPDPALAEVFSRLEVPVRVLPGAPELRAVLRGPGCSVTLTSQPTVPVARTPA
jgi:hypothetical protein